MTYRMMRDDGQIERLEQYAKLDLENGTGPNREAYAQGVRDTLAWLFGRTSECPYPEAVAPPKPYAVGGQVREGRA